MKSTEGDFGDVDLQRGDRDEEDADVDPISGMMKRQDDGKATEMQEMLKWIRSMGRQ